MHHAQLTLEARAAGSERVLLPRVMHSSPPWNALVGGLLSIGGITSHLCNSQVLDYLVACCATHADACRFSVDDAVSFKALLCADDARGLSDKQVRAALHVAAAEVAAQASVFSSTWSLSTISIL